MLESCGFLQARSPLTDMQLKTHAEGTQLHLLADPHATPNCLESVTGLGLKTAASELTFRAHDVSDRPRLCTPQPYHSVRPPAKETDRTSRKQRACGHSSHLFRAEASRGFTNSSRGRSIRQPTSLARDRWIQTVGTSPPLPVRSPSGDRGEGCVPARPPSERPNHRRGDGTVYYLFSPPACHPTLRVHATSAIQPGS